MNTQVLGDARVVLQSLDSQVDPEAIRAILRDGQLQALKYAPHFIGRFAEIDSLCSQFSVIALHMEGRRFEQLPQLVDSACALIDELIALIPDEDNFYRVQ